MLIESILEYQFLRYAYTSGIIIALLFPIVGSFIVMRKQVFITDTISHVSLAGVSFGYFLTIIIPLTFSPTLFGIIAAVMGAVVIEYLRTNYKGFKELSMMIVMTISIAIAIIISSLTTSNINIASFLFGSINTITTLEFYLLIIVFFITLGFVYKYYYTLLAICIDEEYAKLRYNHTGVIKYAFVILVAVIVALAIKIVGVLLLGALITIPVTAALGSTSTFKNSQIFSIVFALISVITGLVISFYIVVPSGASIVIVAMILLIIIKIFRRLL